MESKNQDPFAAYLSNQDNQLQSLGHVVNSSIVKKHKVKPEVVIDERENSGTTKRNGKNNFIIAGEEKAASGISGQKRRSRKSNKGQTLPSDSAKGSN